MAANSSIDEVLAGLASMGFEISECQEAIHAGNTTIESAIEWLVNVKQPKQTSQHSSEEFIRASTSSVVPASEAVTPSGSLTSRYAASEESRAAKENFLRKEREVARIEAKKRKLEEIKARELALKQIADDKEMRKSRTSYKSPPTTGVATTLPTATSSSPADSHLTMLQVLPRPDDFYFGKVRLPDGLVRKVSMAADTILEKAVTSVCPDTSIRSGEAEIIQPFPHKVFTPQEMSMSLKDVGLHPSGSIVIRMLYNQQSRDNDQSLGVLPLRGTDQPALQENHQAIPDLPGGDNELEIPDPEDHDEEHQHDPYDQMAGLDPGNVAMLPRMPQFGPARRHVWGDGVRLGEPNPHARPSQHGHVLPSNEDAGRRQEMIAQCLQRFAESNQEVEDILQLHRDVPRLEDLCITNVSLRLAGQRHLQPLVTLGVLPHNVCDKIISRLVEDKALTPKVLHAFISCCLRYIKLDCYLLVTNDLLAELRFHRQLVHLSIKSCPIITDKALEAVVDLPALTTLQLDNTKISDKGLMYFSGHANCIQTLVHLSLNGTGVTNQGTASLADWKILRILGLENTKITSLDVIRHLQHLKTLNVAFTGVTDECLVALNSHPSLSSLNILQTSVTDRGLQHLKGLPLSSLDLSDYRNITDSGVQYIAGMTSLTRLLLSNTRLTDEGMVQLSGLAKLVELNVDRTVVTDKGSRVLSNFANLQILGLSSTGVTDKLLRDGVLNRCKKLCKLNLSRTSVTNRGIKHLELNSLTLLNLDWTRVTADCGLLLTGCPALKALRMSNCTPPSPGDESGSDDEDQG
ncbi:predicted protein [Nematostella vectensis]|uniref:UBA domain-containing protein n=1 Tax=Nematostella vectensis TaxID=45351 RepID=A7RHX6_NEMVE|nr:predicted protein [Nematostella vectensis]|eukprot:XP_001641117.1 predicted protein [Nematostella vectensis]